MSNRIPIMGFLAGLVALLLACAPGRERPARPGAGADGQYRLLDRFASPFPVRLNGVNVNPLSVLTK